METSESAPSAAPPVIGPSPVEVLKKMLDGLDIKAKVEQMPLDDGVMLHIATDDPGRLIGKHGQTLTHLQFLLNRVLQRLSPGAPHVVVDCERYREQQRDDLVKQALEAAQKVKRWGEPVEVGPFGAFDRSVIHQHIERDPELEAVSDGDEEGGRKKIIIRVKQKPA
jgi:spoIIIJ-associated protein